MPKPGLQRGRVLFRCKMREFHTPGPAPKAGVSHPRTPVGYLWNKDEGKSRFVLAPDV